LLFFSIRGVDIFSVAIAAINGPTKIISIHPWFFRKVDIPASDRIAIKTKNNINITRLAAERIIIVLVSYCLLISEYERAAIKPTGEEKMLTYIRE